MSDTHSHVDPTDVLFKLGPGLGSVVLPCGGYEALHSAIKMVRAQSRDKNNPVVVTHSGDFFEGSIYFTMFKHACDVFGFREFGVDFCTIGNHEFDRGDEELACFIRKSTVEVLAANLDVSKLPSNAALRVDRPGFITHHHDTASMYVLKDYGRMKVAYIGLTHPSMVELAAPSSSLTFMDPIVVLERVVPHARALGASAVIILSHMGIDRDRDIAAAVKGIDLILGGHSHLLDGQFLNVSISQTGQLPEQIGATTILHSGSNSQSLGLCSLTFDGNVLSEVQGRNVLVLEQGRVDAALQTMEQPASDALAPLHALREQGRALLVREDKRFTRALNLIFRQPAQRLALEIVGYGYRKHPYSRIPVRGPDEPSVISLIASAMLYYGRTKDDLLSVAIINAGAVRCELNPGGISMSFIHGKLLPFPVRLCRTLITGKDLRKLLASAVANALDGRNGTGSFPWCAGIYWNYSTGISGDIDVYASIVRNEPVSQHSFDQEIFTLFTTSYMSRGMEGYGLLAERDHDVIGPPIASVFESYVRSGIIDSI